MKGETIPVTPLTADYVSATATRTGHPGINFSPDLYRVGLSPSSPQRKAYLSSVKNDGSQYITTQIAHEDLPDVIEALQTALHHLNNPA